MLRKRGQALSEDTPYMKRRKIEDAMRSGWISTGSICDRFGYSRRNVDNIICELSCFLPVEESKDGHTRLVKICS